MPGSRTPPGRGSPLLHPRGWLVLQFQTFKLPHNHQWLFVAERQ